MNESREEQTPVEQNSASPHCCAAELPTEKVCEGGWVVRMPDPVERCSAFIDAMIELCRNHRVMIELDEACPIEAVEFTEKSNDPSGAAFILGAADLANSVNKALFDELCL